MAIDHNMIISYQFLAHAITTVASQASAHQLASWIQMGSGPDPPSAHLSWKKQTLWSVRVWLTRLGGGQQDQYCQL